MCNLNLKFHSCSDFLFLLNEESPSTVLHKITGLSDAIIKKTDERERQ